MTIDEVRAMCLWLRKLIPHQDFDDDTPEAWTPLLTETPREDARVAVMAILRRSRYVAPLDIVDEVKRMRRERLERVGFKTIAPNVNPDDEAAQRRELLALREAIASGEFTQADRDQYELGGVRLTGEPWRPALDTPTAPRPLPRFPTMREPERPTATQILDGRRITAERRKRLHEANEMEEQETA